MEQQHSTDTDTSKHDIFTDPAIAQAKAEDPLFDFIAKNWQQLLFAAAIIFGGHYMYTRYQSTQYDSRVSASDLFAKVRSSAQELIIAERELASLKSQTDEAQKASLEEAEKKVTEAESSLKQRVAALSDAKQPYAELSNLYKGLAAIRAGNLDQASQDFSQIINLAKTNPDMELYSELARLQLSRSRLDLPEQYSQARSDLKSLAENGHYVNVVAATVLARVSTTSEEKTEALNVLQSLAKMHPEQADLLEEDLERLSAQ